MEGGILSVFVALPKASRLACRGSVGIHEFEAELVCAVKRVLFQVARARRGV